MDRAEESISSSADGCGNPTDGFPAQSSRLNLTLDNIVGDDALRFAAPQPFSGQSSPFDFDGNLDFGGDGLGSGWNTPLASCINCTAWGYQCQTATEHGAQGRCVPCASLGTECSFSGPTGNTVTDNMNNLIQGDTPDSTSSQQPTTPMDSKRLSGTFEPQVASKVSTAPPPKIGTRFSRDSTRILRQWLSSHSSHPYPSDEEKKMLQLQTGLSKIQITNWLINARRRGKVQNRNRSTSPYSGSNGARPIDVPARPGTPAPRTSPRYENLNPLERWVDSPPEHEPATASAIARAVASSRATSSAVEDSFNAALTDEDQPRSLYRASSASSVGTSSGGSFASAYSHDSKSSTGLPRPNIRSRIRQRRRPKRTSLALTRNQYQCTFCTETFRTKHDWQRHEKSLHMPLEKWTCSPDGPRAINPENGQSCCVFCGEVEPGQEHIDSHNPTACQERTFNRKDHLKQHLRLVHNAGLLDWSSKLWRITVPDIRSRCGFCAASLDTWSARADHLADHFKMGQDMANWKGDWGFDDVVLDMVENAVPPYLIEYERFSPFPYQASGTPPESPRSAFELLTLELNHFLRLFYDKTGNMPNNREIQLEACRIVFASEVSCPERSLDAQSESWLRDLITSNEKLTREARFGPIRSPADSMMSVLQIKGKRSLFDGCPCEAQLEGFIEAQSTLGLEFISNQELQSEASKIIARMGKAWGMSPADFVANWLVNLIGSSTKWLTGFRMRKQLSQIESSAKAHAHHASDFGAQNGVSGSLETCRAYAKPSEPFRQFTGERRVCDASTVLYGGSSLYNATPAVSNSQSPDLETLGFPSGDAIGSVPFGQRSVSLSPMATTMPYQPSSPGGLALAGAQWPGTGSIGLSDEGLRIDNPPSLTMVRRNYAFFNDANFNRWLSQELRRWVLATMSPNNPNSHVPSDEEMQHQARFIVYEDGDPWNQTSADNQEWLQRFKRSIGMSTNEARQCSSTSPQQR
ncbi:Homeobox protein 4-like protein 2 [Colletotrichum chlorophyti]|uniref:Homeobox protein 4-like protein 2 n=1 Tax=Colletotrichum chlorophyti TaxID=708187 RepID=A0A1Q8RML1_9PEZI|nr:Homeobox protein 4-like protein 2 [Colletotrichum chlorophyti]